MQDSTNDDTSGIPTGEGEGLTNANTVSYPSYDRDIELFAKFVQEHTLLVVADSSPDESDDDDDNDIPMALGDSTAVVGGTTRIRRVPCYPPHLQRIKDRHFYDDTATHDPTTTTTTGTTTMQAENRSVNRTFTIEVPLSELVAWDAIRGLELAQRVCQNTMRYGHDIFSRVLDEHIQQLSFSDAVQPARTGDDIWQEQRLATQAAATAAADAATAEDANRNPYAGNGAVGGVEEEVQAAAIAAARDTALLAIPPALMRRYELRILPLGRSGTLPPFVHQYHHHKSPSTGSVEKIPPPPPSPISLRHVRSQNLGQLVTVTGLVVRCSDVKPAVTVATYACDACGAEIYQTIQYSREFMPQTSCPSPDCRQRNRRTNNGGGGGGLVHLQTRGSKFVKFQELKLQELPDQVPMGHVPRSMPVLCRGELTRQVSPGDAVTIDGVFLPQRLAESGYKAMKAGLIATTFLEAQNIVVHKKSYDDVFLAQSVSASASAEAAVRLAAVRAIATGPDPMGRLASSIAPEIFGHADIKRALLLQLVGGCTRTLPDGMRIRGDINICLMGDPGVAKSQLLKQVANIAPRGVYTTGKGSSGVGLTAAVTKDAATGEMALEGGALVLADRGVCCIDEFDKMDESDRTAIHEVMEQQTVSIAKAGIIATLNARSSVLAAANPLYGRYNRHKSLSENINLPNSLLSRFDLLFLILDVADVDKDMALARHVALVHENEGRKATGKDVANKDIDNDDDDENSVPGDAPTEPDENHVSPLILREYIARARQHHPYIPPEVAPYVIEAYVSLRQQGVLGHRPSKTSTATAASDQTVMTARQLLSILRISQAVARLRFSDHVAREDVDEAIRLTHMSKASLTDVTSNNKHGSHNGRGGGNDDVMSRIFLIMRDYSTVTGHKVVELKLCEAMALRKGFTVQQLESCLEEYEALDIIQINSARTHVTFVDREM